MVFYKWEQAELVRTCNLWPALRLPDRERIVIALTGAGGKTSVMFRLADEMADAGKRVIVTTTTHIYRPSDRAVAETGDRREIEKWRECGNAGRECGTGMRGCVLVAGLPASDGKLKSLPPEETASLREYADVLLIEADGARQLPIKAPRKGEPVIPAYADVVIGCMGLDSIGNELGRICFRRELAGRLLGWEPELDGAYRRRITPRDAAVILTSEKGTRKSVGGREFRVVLNKADDADRIQKAMQTVMEIDKLRPELCAVTSFLAH